MRATILAATATSADPAYPLDGEDLMPVCRGAGAVHERTFFWRTQSLDAARVGNWKYLKESGNEHLFDLATDPGERADLRRKHGEVFEKIRNQYSAWNAAMLPKRQVG